MRVLVLSRAWVFLCAAAAFLAFGADRSSQARFGAPAIADPFGGAGQALLGIWSRWDSVWYLGVAHHGYGVGEPSAAFFPLLPLLSRAVAAPIDLVAGRPAAIFLGALAVSLAAFGVALYFLHRLVAVELGDRVAMLCVALVAFFPMAVFQGAIYSESLFLALSAAAVWFARSDRWAAAGTLAAATVLTRSAGILLIVPLALLYLLGPRGQGQAERPYLGAPWRRREGPRAYPLRRDALWIGLAPTALAGFAVYLGFELGDSLAFAHAQADWGRELGHIGSLPAAFAGGLWQGVVAAASGLADLVRGRASAGELLWAPDGGLSLSRAGINLEAGLFLAFAVIATIGALRRLPLAYGAYAAAALALALSYPRSAVPGYDVPLFSLPRFLAVVFPLFIWLALVVSERGWERPALLVLALLLGLYAAQWGTWQWVS